VSPIRSDLRRRSSRAEREFGLLVGGILAVLGTWWIYRDKFETAAPILLGLGGLLIVLGGLWPRALAVPYRAWMALAEQLSRVATFLVLSFVFFFVVTPIGLVKRATGWDPLGRRAAPSPSYWRAYGPRQRDVEHYEKMF
jgi:hypothetical protein